MPYTIVWVHCYLNMLTKCIVLKNPAMAHNSIQSNCHNFLLICLLELACQQVRGIPHYFIEPCLLLPVCHAKGDTKPAVFCTDDSSAFLI